MAEPTSQTPAPDPPGRNGRIVAAFDFDGTITTSDSLKDFIRFALGSRRFAAGVARSAPWLLGAWTRLCDRGSAKARFLEATIGGMHRTELEALARSYVASGLPALVRPEMTARIREHQRLGHQLVLVSASPTLYLNDWCAQAGFDALLATELEFLGETFSGRLARPNCWGPEKACTPAPVVRRRSAAGAVHVRRQPGGPGNARPGRPRLAARPGPASAPPRRVTAAIAASAAHG